jgi:hypothetical protein
MSNHCAFPASFRDSSGFVFIRDGVFFRQINKAYREDYQHLMACGLYDKLITQGLLISHEELAGSDNDSESCYKTIRPQQLDFVSYPYEWCFSQLKAAALALLAIQRQALQHGMILKDAGAFNMQFYKGRPVLIDTLSFEKYSAGRPWPAYRQFCQNFLAPLAINCYCPDLQSQFLFKTFLDGIPLDTASRLLPWQTFLRFSTAAHIHAHSFWQKRYCSPLNADIAAGTGSSVSLRGVCSLVDSLESAITSLRWKPQTMSWGSYYDEFSYSSQAFERKQAIVAGFLDKIKPGMVWDVGANTGVFTRLASSRKAMVIALDSDPITVELNYKNCRRDNDSYILPLIVNIANPSPAVGWAHEERLSLAQRGPADVLLALALMHHLTVAENVPLDKIAKFFRQLTEWLVIEFVPWQDARVQEMLILRADSKEAYTCGSFEKAFEEYFSLEARTPIEGSGRVIYLFKKRQP